MKKFIMSAFAWLLLMATQLNAQTYLQSGGDEPLHPDVPRISAYEAYLKYKEGKAIILHAGGESFSGRHILGAFNLDIPAMRINSERKRILETFPKEGIEIFTYCY